MRSSDPVNDLVTAMGRRGVDLTVWPPRYNRRYWPDHDAEYWLPELECAPCEVRDEIILKKLTHQIRFAWERSPFYRRRWEEAGVSPATLKSLDDLARFPVVQKAELRAVQADSRPFGDNLCIEARSDCPRARHERDDWALDGVRNRGGRLGADRGGSCARHVGRRDSARRSDHDLFVF